MKTDAQNKKGPAADGSHENAPRATLRGQSNQRRAGSQKRAIGSGSRGILPFFVATGNDRRVVPRSVYGMDATQLAAHYLIHRCARALGRQ
jgi:hypothetical protein